MNWDSFLNFIKNSATNEVKFFGSRCKSDDFGTIVTAFANTKGGYIVIGFDKNNYHLTGTDHSVEWVNNLIQTYCLPKIEYECFQIEKNDKKIIIVNISQNYDKPYYFNDRCYVLNTEKSKISVMEKEIIDGTPRVLKRQSINDDKENKSISLPNADKASTKDNKIKTEAEELEDLTKELLDLTDDFPKPDTNLPFTVTDESSPESDSHENKEEIEIELNNNPSLDLENSNSKPNSLNERQEKALVYLTKNSNIKNKKYRELFNVSHKTAHLELIDLVQKKLIKSQGSGRSTCYVINMPVQQKII